MEGSSGQYSDFDSTRWPVIEVAGGEDGSKRRKALDKLLSVYMPALRAYLVAKRHIEANRADDLLHDFVTEKILQGSLLRRADHTKGRFRSLLLKALNNYLVDRHRSTRSKEPTSAAAKSLDDLGSADPDHPRDTEVDVFEAVWARTVLMTALADLHRFCKKEKREQTWTLFEERLLQPLVWGTPPTPYDQIIKRLGFATAEQASNAFITAKRQFRRVLQSRIAPYTKDKAFVEAEISELQRILATSGSMDLDFPTDSPFDSATLDTQSIRRLARLLDLNEDEPSPWNDAQLAASFEHHLVTPLREKLHERLPRLTAGLLLMASEDQDPIVTLGDLFQHPYPPVEVMRAVKDWAKHCIQQNDESTPPQIASIIYLAAVATALVRCDQRITHSENTDLQVTFRQALGAAWLSRDVRRIFEEAMAQLKRE